MENKVEFKKEIGFDDIRAGDELVIEYFTEDGHPLGESRGTASYLFDGNWHFYDRGPLYRGDGHRLFKVMPDEDLLTTEAGEFARLLSIEARIREQIDKLETKRGLALGFSKDLRSEWEIERALVWEGKANKYLDKIQLLKEVLGDS